MKKIVTKIAFTALAYCMGNTIHACDYSYIPTLQLSRATPTEDGCSASGSSYSTSSEWQIIPISPTKPLYHLSCIQPQATPDPEIPRPYIKPKPYYPRPKPKPYIDISLLERIADEQARAARPAQYDEPTPKEPDINAEITTYLNGLQQDLLNKRALTPRTIDAIVHFMPTVLASKEYTEKHKVLCIYAQLVGQEYKEVSHPALTTAQKYINAPDQDLQEGALTLFQSLILQKHIDAYLPAIQAVETILTEIQKDHCAPHMRTYLKKFTLTILKHLLDEIPPKSSEHAHLPKEFVRELRRVIQFFFIAFAKDRDLAKTIIDIKKL